ncbi:MAG TPA: histidine kinase dimerization/phospho-acceptor domain-containing protein, partial [Blastocatellia bacterium]|nr:histidine kinase dimerization/phospho-acceptor domain-containing protein [Blastocatellia bacterium]
MNRSPRSLFFKILLWFGTTMLTMMVITFLVGEFVRHGPGREGPQINLAGYDDVAAQTYERAGQEALATYLDRIDRETNMHTFLYGPQLTELSGRPAPDRARQLAESVARTKKPALSINESSPMLAFPVRSPLSNEYVWVAEFPPHEPGPWYHHFVHLLGLFLIGSLFCVWLAKYLTAPVATLRRATQELANGNLSARVTPNLDKRRDELASLGWDFDVMADRIELLLTAQRRLLGDISHELRSPLARLNIALELARQRSGPDATSALERIQREAENMNEMVGQLLALTRLETGARESRIDHFDLARLVRGIAEDADFEARSRNRSVQVSSCDRLVVSGNEDLLRRAIENVVRNAVQYTAEESAVEICLKRNSGHDGHDRLQGSFHSSNVDA